MQSFYTFIALDLARERAAQADAHRLAALARSGRSEVGVIRRIVARAALAVARAADSGIEQVPLASR